MLPSNELSLGLSLFFFFVNLDRLNVFFKTFFRLFLLLVFLFVLDDDEDAADDDDDDSEKVPFKLRLLLFLLPFLIENLRRKLFPAERVDPLSFRRSFLPEPCVFSDGDDATDCVELLILRLPVEIIFFNDLLNPILEYFLVTSPFSGIERKIMSMLARKNDKDEKLVAILTHEIVRIVHNWYPKCHDVSHSWRFLVG